MLGNAKTKKKRNRPLLIAFGFGLILLLLLGVFLVAEANRENEKQINHITYEYIQFQSHIESFFTSNINLVTGFAAYIQTFEQYEDKDVYTYLDNLAKNNSEYINNIGIIRDTTIIWNYPLKGNEKSIGVDLSKIPEQAAAISYVKTNLKYHFDGPKKLVQGGTGYIIRMPLVKDGTYWGLVSVVLKADKMQELFREYEKESNLEVAIVNRSNGRNLIFGDASILEKDPLAFDSTFSGNQWTIYVVPADPEMTNLNYLMIITLGGIIIILVIVRYIYIFFREAEHVKEKNDILNNAVFRDRLTGIYNRSFLDIRIREEIDLANRHGTNLSIIYFDLDHFKRVNDEFGHNYGDSVLREVSQTVERMLRTSDILARWGGEEFAILMPSTTLQGAVTAAEKIRAVVEAIEHPYVGKVTASFGVAEYYPYEYAGSWFNRVDNVLYRSKEEGRNRVTACEALADDTKVQYRIKWLEEWNSGNNVIDVDHRELLRLGNHLVEDSYTMNTMEESISRYNELLDYIVSHFEREEQILERAGFDELNGHRGLHRDLIKIGVDYRDQLTENKIDAQSLFDFLLKEVVIGHINKEDIKFYYLF